MPSHDTQPPRADDRAAWLAALIASSDDAIVGADDRGCIVVWNRGAETLYGHPAEEVIGRPLASLRAAECGSDLEDILERLAGGESPPSFDATHLRRDGSKVDVSVTASPIRDDEGRVIGSSAIIRDITATKADLDALERAVERERAVVEKLTDLDRVRASFVSAVSHELRTPLTSILGYLELLMEDQRNLNEHQREMLGIVSRNSDRLLALIEDLLVLSRIETGAFKVLKEPVDVWALVTAVAREMEPRVVEAKHRLTVQIDDRVGSVLGDASELERLLVGLLSNAIKFTEPGGDIRLAARPTPEGTVVEVTDTGMGIPAKEIENVFEPFFRSAAADKRAIPGTGLGLSIAKTIVEQHGGTISCTSAPGRGTTMRILLPFAIPDRKAS